MSKKLNKEIAETSAKINFRLGYPNPQLYDKITIIKNTFDNFKLI